MDEVARIEGLMVLSPIKETNVADELEETILVIPPPILEDQIQHQ